MRLFGRLRLLPGARFDELPELRGLPPDPLAHGIDATALQARLRQIAPAGQGGPAGSDDRAGRRQHPGERGTVASAPRSAPPRPIAVGRGGRGGWRKPCSLPSSIRWRISRRRARPRGMATSCTWKRTRRRIRFRSTGARGRSARAWQEEPPRQGRNHHPDRAGRPVDVLLPRLPALSRAAPRWYTAGGGCHPEVDHERTPAPERPAAERLDSPPPLRPRRSGRARHRRGARARTRDAPSPSRRPARTWRSGCATPAPPATLVAAIRALGRQALPLQMDVTRRDGDRRARWPRVGARARATRHPRQQRRHRPAQRRRARHRGRLRRHARRQPQGDVLRQPGGGPGR